VGRTAKRVMVEIFRDAWRFERNSQESVAEVPASIDGE
jgi:hypothetical protein